MDARLDVEEALGLRTGDAHIIRNAGGLVTDDVIRSLIVSQQLLGTNEIVVIEHTRLRAARRRRGGHPRAGRGRGRRDGRGRRARVRRRSPTSRRTCATQVAILREHQLLRRVPVHGLIFDVVTGRLHEVA